MFNFAIFKLYYIKPWQAIRLSKFLPTIIWKFKSRKKKPKSIKSRFTLELLWNIKIWTFEKWISGILPLFLFPVVKRWEPKNRLCQQLLRIDHLFSAYLTPWKGINLQTFPKVCENLTLPQPTFHDYTYLPHIVVFLTYSPCNWFVVKAWLSSQNHLKSSIGHPIDRT